MRQPGNPGYLFIHLRAGGRPGASPGGHRLECHCISARRPWFRSFTATAMAVSASSMSKLEPAAARAPTNRARAHNQRLDGNHCVCVCINVRAPSNCSALTSFSTCFCPYKLVTGPATPKPAGNRLQSLAKISEQSESLPITASTRPCRVEHEYPHISAQASLCIKLPDSRLKKSLSDPPAMQP